MGGAKVDDIVAKFPNKVLEAVIGEPTYETINRLVQILYGNAATLPTKLGGGRHGHIGLIMKATLYATLSNTAWVDPPNPGPTATIPNGASAAEREQLRAEHEAKVREYENEANMDTALKTLLLEAVPECYVKELRNRYTAFLGVKTRDLIDHLMDRYGKITPAELRDNKSRMEEPIDSSQPIDIYWQRVDDCIQYAADGNTPFTAEQILQTVLLAVMATGLYKDDVKAWRKKDPADKNWSSFKTHFAEAYHEMKEDQRLTSDQGGFHSANAMVDVAGALDNLALAATADRDIVQQLTMANMELAASNATLTGQLAAITEQLGKAMETIKMLATKQGTKSGHQQQKPPNTFVANQNYCWTHGYKLKGYHTSKTCPAKAEGHKDEATRSNTMGGSEANKDWKPE